MRLLPGLSLALLWVGAWFISTAARKTWLFSFAQSTDSVISTIMLVWPLASGIGAAQAAYATQSGIRERVMGWPGLGLLRLAWQQLSRTLVITVSGGLVSLVLATGIALWYGSEFNFSSMWGDADCCYWSGYLFDLGLDSWIIVALLCNSYGVALHRIFRALATI